MGTQLPRSMCMRPRRIRFGGEGRALYRVGSRARGRGIPEAHLARIFDEFHGADSSNTEVMGGTGLGLAIAREIVEMHSGRI